MWSITVVLLLVTFTGCIARPQPTRDPDVGVDDETVGGAIGEPSKDYQTETSVAEETSGDVDGSLESDKREDATSEDGSGVLSSGNQESPDDSREREDEQDETDDDEEERKPVNESGESDSEEETAIDDSQLKPARAMETTPGASMQSTSEGRQAMAEAVLSQSAITGIASTQTSTNGSQEQINVTDATENEVSYTVASSTRKQETNDDGKQENTTVHTQEAASVMHSENSHTTPVLAGTNATSTSEMVNANENEGDLVKVSLSSEEHSDAGENSTNAPQESSDGLTETSTNWNGSSQEVRQVSSDEEIQATLPVGKQYAYNSSIKQHVSGRLLSLSNASETSGVENNMSLSTNDQRTTEAIAALQVAESDEQTVDSSLSRNNEPTDSDVPVMNSFSFDLPMYNESLHGDLMLNDTEWAKDLAAAAHPDEENIIHDPCTFISENIHSVVGLNVSKEQVHHTLPMFRFLLESSTEDLTTIKDVLMTCVHATNNQVNVNPGCIQIRTLIGKTCHQFEACRGKEDEVMVRVMNRIREVIDTDQLADALLMIRACAGQVYE